MDIFNEAELRELRASGLPPEQTSASSAQAAPETRGASPLVGSGSMVVLRPESVGALLKKWGEDAAHQRDRWDRALKAKDFDAADRHFARYTTLAAVWCDVMRQAGCESERQPQHNVVDHPRGNNAP